MNHHHVKPHQAPFQPAASVGEYAEIRGVKTLAEAKDPTGLLAQTLIGLEGDASECIDYITKIALTHVPADAKELQERKDHAEWALADLAYSTFYAGHVLGVDVESAFRKLHGDRMNESWDPDDEDQVTL